MLSTEYQYWVLIFWIAVIGVKIADVHMKSFALFEIKVLILDIKLSFIFFLLNNGIFFKKKRKKEKKNMDKKHNFQIHHIYFWNQNQFIKKIFLVPKKKKKKSLKVKHFRIFFDTKFELSLYFLYEYNNVILNFNYT